MCEYCEPRKTVVVFMQMDTADTAFGHSVFNPLNRVVIPETVFRHSNFDFI